MPGGAGPDRACGHAKSGETISVSAEGRTMLRRLVRKLRGRLFHESSEERFAFFDVGFHGDLHLLEVVNAIMSKCNVFVETGTNVGSTLAYVARTYPGVLCFSCEPDVAACSHAKNNIAKYDNVRLSNETSKEFLKRLLAEPDILNGEVAFWLDAHGHGFEWPLREEVRVITDHWERAFLLIDDFLVPGLDCFGYDEYGGQVCSFDFIKDSLSGRRQYNLYYPQYTDRTSRHHPLRGWGLIEYGHPDGFDLPERLKGRVIRHPWL